MIFYFFRNPIKSRCPFLYIIMIFERFYSIMRNYMEPPAKDILIPGKKKPSEGSENLYPGGYDRKADRRISGRTGKYQGLSDPVRPGS